MRLTPPLAILAAVACAALAHADTLVFKDGRQMEGTVVEEDADSVTFRKGSIISKFRRAEIEKIIRGGNETRDPADEKLRASRLSPTGDAALDPLRAAVEKALDAVQEKKRGLETAARKVEAPTKAYEAQLKKLSDAEVDVARVRARLVDAEAKLRKAETAAENARVTTGRIPAPLKAEVDERSAARASVEKTLATALQRVEVETRALDEVTDRFQMAADSIRPAVQALAAAIGAADKAWGALAAAEGAGAGTLPWWPAAESSRVLLEGRIVSVTKDQVVLVTGMDADPATWTERLQLQAAGHSLKPGTTALLRARRDGADWILEEVVR